MDFSGETKVLLDQILELYSSKESELLHSCQEGYYLLLFSIFQAGSVYPSELVKKTGLSRARITNLLAALETKGYITKKDDPTDLRRFSVSLTESGQGVLSSKITEVLEFLQNFLVVLGEEDTKNLIRILNKINDFRRG